MESRFLQSISVIKLSLTRIWCQYVPRESGPASWVPETWHIRSPTQGSLSAWTVRTGMKLGEEVSSLLKVNGCCCAIFCKAEDSCLRVRLLGAWPSNALWLCYCGKPATGMASVSAFLQSRSPSWLLPALPWLLFCLMLGKFIKGEPKKPHI